MCLAPVILLGYLLTVQTSWHQTTAMDAPMLEVQTCETGLGAAAHVSASGLAGLVGQYGLQWTHGDWSFTLQPKAGLSHAMQPVYELPAQTQFQLGLGLLVGYQSWRVGLEYGHASNAGLASPNIGIDTIALQTGWSFE
jgi:hypothetical protein